MEIEFIGAAQTVTGSKHLVRTARSRVLLDCGLFQGRRAESNERNRSLGVDAGEVTAVVLSHAHIDHSGALPVLVKRGYRGPIFCTPATRDLCATMLLDAARIQQHDARFINKLVARGETDMTPVEPLYDEEDVLRVLEAMIAVPYHRALPITPDVELSFHDAGHVLGSAVVVLDVREAGATRRLVFTGDLGRGHVPILRDPECPPGADALLTESTYGDRLHAPIEGMEAELAAVLRRVHARGGKVVIPSFALERAQEVVLALRNLDARGQLPPMPVYVDSPLTVKLTEVFKLHGECLNAEARAQIAAGESLFDFGRLRYVSETEDSKAIDAEAGPSVILSASGMCEGGRVLHHLKATVEDARNAVLIVGFQAQHTLGRRIVERRQRVKIFGVERDLRAEVVVMNGFSAHADQADLVRFARESHARSEGKLAQVLLVHGEPVAQHALSKLVRAALPGVTVRAPERGDRVTM